MSSCLRISLVTWLFTFIFWSIIQMHKLTILNFKKKFNWNSVQVSLKFCKNGLAHPALFISVYSSEIELDLFGTKKSRDEITSTTIQMVVYDAKYLSLLKEMTIIWVQFYFIFCVFRCFHKNFLNSLIWAFVMFYQSCARSEIQSSLLRKPISCKVNKAHIMFVYNIPFTCIDKTLVEIPVSNILKKQNWNLLYGTLKTKTWHWVSVCIGSGK